MKFSIVTPVRNGMPYITGAIESCRSQEGVEVQHFVQDANSTDGLAQYLRGDSSVVLCTEADGGMYDAINRGWSKADGDILSWLNSDEQYIPGALARVKKAFIDYPEADVIFGDVVIVDKALAPLAYRREYIPRAFVVSNTFLYIYSCSIFYRRRLWDDGILKLDSSYRYAADMDLILRLLTNGVTFKSIYLPIATYMATGQNLSLDSQMTIETKRLRKKFGNGGVFSKISANLIRAMDRGLCGGFFPRSGEHEIWDHNVCDKRVLSYTDLGFRYSIFDEV